MTTRAEELEKVATSEVFGPALLIGEIQVWINGCGGLQYSVPLLRGEMGAYSAKQLLAFLQHWYAEQETKP